MYILLPTSETNSLSKFGLLNAIGFDKAYNARFPLEYLFK
jgi:hypothetical protein